MCKHNCINFIYHYPYLNNSACIQLTFPKFFHLNSVVCIQFNSNKIVILSCIKRCLFITHKLAKSYICICHHVRWNIQVYRFKYEAQLVAYITYGWILFRYSFYPSGISEQNSSLALWNVLRQHRP